MKGLMLALLLGLGLNASADSNLCTNPGYCTMVQFKKDSPLDYILQNEVELALQHGCDEVLHLTEKETTVSYTTDSGAILDTIYKSVLTGNKYDENGHPLGFEVYVTLTNANIANPTVTVENQIEIEGCNKSSK